MYIHTCIRCTYIYTYIYTYTDIYTYIYIYIRVYSGGYTGRDIRCVCRGVKSRRRNVTPRNGETRAERDENVSDPGTTDEIRTSACTTRVRDAGGRAHVAPTWRGVPFHIIQR